MENAVQLEPLPSFDRVSDSILVALGPSVNGRVLSNSVAFMGERATLIADTLLSPNMAKSLVDEVNRAHGRPVRFVLNTHADPDHVMGNAAFDSQTVFIGHEQTGRLLDTSDPALRKRVVASGKKYDLDLEQVEIVPPEISFRNDLTISLGAIEVHAHFVGPAHSPADTVLWCPQERLVMTADIVFNGVFPVVRNEIDLWIDALDYVARLEPEVVVPGHGSVGGPELIEEQRRLLEDGRREVRALMDADVTLDEALERPVLTEYRHLRLAEERISQLVRGVYASPRR